MGFFRDYQFDTTKVTAVCVDTNNGNFIWLAYAANGGSCILEKVSATDLTQVYFTVSVPVSAINAMVITNGYIFLAVISSQYYSIAYSISSPLTTYVTQSFPTGISESPVAAVVGPSQVDFLTPGNAPGTYAAIVSVGTLNVWFQTIVLNQNSVFVNNAVSITIDSSSNWWIITGGTPGFLIRVWSVSGSWNFQETELI